MNTTLQEQLKNREEQYSEVVSSRKELLVEVERLSAVNKEIKEQGKELDNYLKSAN